MTLYVHINFIFVKNGLTVYDISYVWREMDTSRRFVQLPSARLQEYFAQVEICRVHQDWHEAEGHDWV